MDSLCKALYLVTTTVSTNIPWFDHMLQDAGTLLKNDDTLVNIREHCSILPCIILRSREVCLVLRPVE